MGGAVVTGYTFRIDWVEQGQQCSLELNNITEFAARAMTTGLNTEGLMASCMKLAQKWEEVK